MSAGVKRKSRLREPNNGKGLKIRSQSNQVGIVMLGVSLEDAIPIIPWWEVSVEDSNNGGLPPLKANSNPLKNQEGDIPTLQHSGDGENMDIGAIFFFGLYLIWWVIKGIFGLLGLAAFAVSVAAITWYQQYWYLSPVFLAAGILLTSPLWLNRAYEYANDYTSYYISHVWARILFFLGLITLIEAMVFDSPQFPITDLSMLYIVIGILIIGAAGILFSRSSW